jgi:phosphoadenosine phosphosulfate reductase
MTTTGLMYDTLTDGDYLALNDSLAGKQALDVIRWGYHQFGDDLIYSCSFGVEGMVLIDLISQVRPIAKILFLDTHKHFRQTYELIEKTRARYPELQIQIVEPEISLEQQSAMHGENLWVTNPDQCCNIRKIQPLQRALSGSRAWMSGLRREQSQTRSNVEFVNKDNKFNSIKICPLIHWTWKDVWNYVQRNQLPYNELHDQGYPSIGCETCTLPVNGDGDSRAGRWANSGKTECGLHK